MDRPELREKIVSIIDTVVYASKVCHLVQPFYSECRADEILALIPDIEEAKKQERERILKEIGDNAFAEPQDISQSGREPVIICLTVSDWQALKEKK